MINWETLKEFQFFFENIDLQLINVLLSPNRNKIILVRWSQINRGYMNNVYLKCDLFTLFIDLFRFNVQRKENYSPWFAEIQRR